MVGSHAKSPLKWFDIWSRPLICDLLPDDSSCATYYQKTIEQDCWNHQCRSSRPQWVTGKILTSSISTASIKLSIKSLMFCKVIMLEFAKNQVRLLVRWCIILSLDWMRCASWETRMVISIFLPLQTKINIRSSWMTRACQSLLLSPSLYPV